MERYNEITDYLRIFRFIFGRRDMYKFNEEMFQNIQTYQFAVSKVCDLIWEIDIHKNICRRIQEREIAQVQKKDDMAYRKLVEYYLDCIVHPEDRKLFREAADVEKLREAQRIGKELIRQELRFLRPDNEYQWYTVATVLFPNEAAYLFGWNIQELKDDIIERYVVEQRYADMIRRSEYQKEVAQSNERYEHVNELTGNFVFEYNVPDKKYYVCALFEEMFELKKGMLDNEWSFLEGLEPYEKDAQKFQEFLARIKAEPDTHELTLRLYNKYHKPIWFTVTVQTLNGLGNVLTRLIGVIQNVNSEMEIKAELEYRSDYDSVTGLYNSSRFYRNAAEIIFHNPDKKHVILSVDIEHFRMINDRFGIDAGNRCLKFMGGIIKETLGNKGIAGRYQADIFTILLSCNDEEEYADFVDCLSQRFIFPEAAQCGSTLSFGVYFVVDVNIPVQLMCDRARLAKMAIKGSKLVNCAVYDDSIRLKQRVQSEIESEMQRALDNNEFVMYLQPKYDLRTEKVAGAEALVRWRHPLKGIRMPGEFLPLFENNGFIKMLDEYIWECAAAYIARMKKTGKAVPISINISRLHINTTDLVSVLGSLIKRYGIEPEYLELEITETIFMEDVSQLYSTMRDLKAAGFVIEMDDFGSGYSSLNMLRNAPIDVVKIDRFFLDEIMSTERGRIIVENTIIMSKKLGLRVVAEGVETEEQKEFLCRAGCDIAQGYFYSRPLPEEEFEKLL